jgi:23S rRNA (cytosine1962-C5)-methyltransferase
MSTTRPTVTLKKKEDRRLRSGHLWAFSNEIYSITGLPQAGDLVELRDAGGKLVGTGMYNPNSLIAVRLVTYGDEPFEYEDLDVRFFEERIGAALAMRKKILPDAESFRLVHSEADHLPGLTIDKYNDFVSIQALSFGMDKRLAIICDALEKLLPLKGVVERNDAHLRSYEGLPERKGILRGLAEPVIITEHDIRYSVDLLEGQKTGFFLDQRLNRLAVRNYCKGARVLDCFCNEGGFAFNAACAGASQVTAVEISAATLSRARHNQTLNSFDAPIEFVEADAFTFLSEAAAAGKQYDVVILDPPSFSKSRKAVSAALQGYRAINRNALRLLPKGGILVTASCSQHVYEEVFLEMIDKTARQLNRSVTLLEWRGASPDHPVLPAMPETKYLKFGIFYVNA